MFIFDRKFSFFLVLVTLPLLFFPKINLIRFEKETAGIRIDDVILLFFSIIFFWAYFTLNKRMTLIESSVVVLLLFSLFSFFINQGLVAIGYLSADAKLFYSIRVFEYFLFFYVGVMATQFVTAHAVVKWLLIWNVALMVFQKMGFIGGITSDGYDADVSSRLTGISSFPSEAGFLLTLMFAFLLYQEKSEVMSVQRVPVFMQEWIYQLYLYFLFLFFSLLVIFTGSRMAIVALVICFIFKLWNEFKKQFNKKAWIYLFPALLFIPLAIIVMALAIFKTSSLMERSFLFSMNNFTLIAQVWEQVDIGQDPTVRESLFMGEHDQSWWIRVHKWCYALKIYMVHPLCYLFGIGPGFALAALDGGLLRILTENGLVGSLLYYRFFSQIYKQNIQLKWMVIVFLINMVFFDAYLAYKGMSLLFFVSGYTYASFKKKEDAFLYVTAETKV